MQKAGNKNIGVPRLNVQNSLFTNKIEVTLKVVYSFVFLYLTKLLTDSVLKIMSLQGKIALVTGASRGIGRGIALQLGNNGAKVYITGRKPEQSLATQYTSLPSLEKTAKGWLSVFSETKMLIKGFRNRIPWGKSYCSLHGSLGYVGSEVIV